MIFVKVLCGGFEFEYFLLVWVYLDKYRKGERKGNECY